jgi:serine/threonine-protein kinase HipA
MRRLQVYYQDRPAGVLEETDEGYRFSYTADWIEKGQSPVSLTLPLRGEPWKSRTLFAFFDGLIPEGWLLDLGTRNWKLDPKDRFALLGAFCRDTIGAVGLGPIEAGVGPDEAGVGPDEAGVGPDEGGVALDEGEVGMDE